MQAPGLPPWKGQLSLNLLSLAFSKSLTFLYQPGSALKHKPVSISLVPSFHKLTTGVSLNLIAQQLRLSTISRRGDSSLSLKEAFQRVISINHTHNQTSPSKLDTPKDHKTHEKKRTHFIPHKCRSQTRPKTFSMHAKCTQKSHLSSL